MPAAHPHDGLDLGTERKILRDRAVILRDAGGQMGDKCRQARGWYIYRYNTGYNTDLQCFSIKGGQHGSSATCLLCHLDQDLLSLHIVGVLAHADDVVDLWYARRG